MCLLDHDFYSEKRGAEYELTLSAWGEGVLSESGLLEMQKPDAIIKKFKAKYRRYPKSISLIISDPGAVGYDFGFTGVETALLEKLETLKELILPDSVTQIEITPKLGMILKNNDTLIRGGFDSFAQSFAKENGLHFRPADLVFAEYESTRPPESTKMTLVFKRSGDVLIKESVFSPGTSCSNTLGGSFEHSLKKDFYLSENAETVAGRFSSGLCAEILADGRLAAFMEKARTHDYFKGNN